VTRRRELSRFIKLPFRLYASAPNWVPPLIAERKRHLDRGKNPFFEHAEAEYFLAWRGDEPIGRISAHVDERLNGFQRNEWGLFGFFECEDDPEVAAALFDTAEAWLAEHGGARAAPPAARELAPALLPPALRGGRLHQGDGSAQVADPRQRAPPGAAGDLRAGRPARARARHRGAQHPKARLRAKEIRAFMEVYNSARERNWGFIPLTEAELESFASELKPIIQEKWGLIAEADGEVVGAALPLDDYNQVLAGLAGRLLPFGWLKLLRERRKIDEIRVFALGVKPDYQHTGTAAAFYVNVWETCLASNVRRAETGWILETNEPMNRAMEALGGDVVKRYRIYEREIGA
jgi:hypothetical protein